MILSEQRIAELIASMRIDGLYELQEKALEERAAIVIRGIVKETAAECARICRDEWTQKECDTLPVEIGSDTARACAWIIEQRAK